MSLSQGPLARDRGPMSNLWQQNGLEIRRLPLLLPLQEGRVLWSRSLGPQGQWVDPAKGEAGGWESSSVT